MAAPVTLSFQCPDCPWGVAVADPRLDSAHSTILGAFIRHAQNAHGTGPEAARAAFCRVYPDPKPSV